MKAQPEASHFVEGVYVEDAAGAAFEVVYPATGAVIARLHAATPAVIEAALASVPTGRRVYAAAADGVRHVTMELGGKSPLIIFDDADLESAVGAAMLANFYSSGQVCSNGTRVFVQAGTCWINAYNLTPVEAPFGGSKISGAGRENGCAAVEHYTQIKSVCVGMGPVDAPY